MPSECHALSRATKLSPYPIPATINEIASQSLICNEREITFIGFIGSLCLFITFGENTSVQSKPVEAYREHSKAQNMYCFAFITLTLEPIRMIQLMVDPTLQCPQY